MPEGPVKEKAFFYQSRFDFFAGNQVSWDDVPAHLGPGDENSPTEESLSDFDRVLQIRAEGYAVFFLAKDTPEKNCSRRYTITYQPSLWDKYTVCREWGRLGSERIRHHQEHFRTSRSALSRIHYLIRRRLKHGYQLTSAA